MPSVGLEDNTDAEGRHRLLLDLFLCRLTTHILSHLAVEGGLLGNTIVILDESDDLIDIHDFAFGSSQTSESTELYILFHKLVETIE